jgi:hypothetical protein
MGKVSATVQIFYAYRVYMLSRSKILVILITLVSLNLFP